MLPEETPQMPPAADNPPSDRVGADLPIASSADAAPSVPPSAASEPEGQSDVPPGDQPRRRRRRRRRRPPGAADTAAAGKDPAVISADEALPGAPDTDADPGVGAGGAEADPAPGAAHTIGDRPHRRRRRRRPPPGGLGSALPPADPAAVAQIAAGDGSEPESTANGEPGAAA